MAYEITAHRDGYRRAGMAHRSTPTVHPSDAFTKEQLAQLEADPRIMIREVPDTADTPDAQELLTSKQAADIAGVSVRRLQKWVETRRLRAVQRHPKTLIDRHDLDAFLHDQPPLPGLTEDDLDDLRLITAKQAADIAQVHLHTLQRWVARGELHAVRQRPKVLIARKDLDEFLSNRVPPPQGFAVAYEARAEDDASRPLTAKQAADIAKVHPSSVRIWVREGKLEAVEQQPLILIDPATLEAFLRDRDRASPRRIPAEEMVEVWRPEDQAHDTDDPVPDEQAMLDVLRMPAVDTPKDEVWRTLVLAQQREIEAAKAREARLLDLLDQATQPTPRTPQRVKVSEMTLVHKVKRYLESVGRPQRAWQVQQALKLDKPPHRELSRLYGRGEIRRLRDGIYAALDQIPR